jgi:hypothetical protein
VASPHHYENLVDPDFGYVGIGIAMSGSTMFVAEEFMELMPVKVTATVTVPTLPKVTTTTAAPATTTTTAPKPAAPKPAAPKAVAPPVVPAQAPVAPPAPPAADNPAPAATPASPAVTPAAPATPPRAPSPLLVSVLERLRSFDS